MTPNHTARAETLSSIILRIGRTRTSLAVSGDFQRAMVALGICDISLRKYRHGWISAVTALVDDGWSEDDYRVEGSGDSVLESLDEALDQLAARLLARADELREMAAEESTIPD